jgi:16S rRNA (cytosine1402-N4)-methyltransferase
MSSEASSAQPHHRPVLVEQVLKVLAPAPGQTIVDATVGAGGHARLLAERLGPTGRLIGLDRDSAMLALARQRLKGCYPAALVHASFDQLPQVLGERGIKAVDGLLADLGMCSDQVDAPERGFSFQHPGPLDMRMDPSQGEPASAWLHRLSERDLANLFWIYGEERYSRRIARRIVETRRREPLQNTVQLAELVRRCSPRSHGRRAIDPATRVFQALRIAVNDELATLDRLLTVLPDIIKPGGRVAIISFHSLEDRRVKVALRDRQRWETFTSKPVQPDEEELRVNPRARSAKLRAARLLQSDKETRRQGDEEKER